MRGTFYYKLSGGNVVAVIDCNNDLPNDCDSGEWVEAPLSEYSPAWDEAKRRPMDAAHQPRFRVVAGRLMAAETQP